MAARTARESSPRRSPPKTSGCTCCTGPSRRASAPPTSPGSAGASSSATRYWSRWTRTGSHAPEDLPRLLDALGDADLVLGSRYLPGGRVVNWPKRREFLSRGGNIYSKLALGVRINDITGGFRAYRREVLEKLALDEIASHGYCFQVDLAWRTSLAGFRVVEVPITFTERVRGESKMSGAIVREALWRVTQWGLRRRASHLRSLTRRG